MNKCLKTLQFKNVMKFLNKNYVKIYQIQKFSRISFLNYNINFKFILKNLKLFFIFFKIIRKYNISKINLFNLKFIVNNKFLRKLKVFFNLKFLVLLNFVYIPYFSFFLKSKDITNLQILLFQNRKIICNLNFLLNNTIGCLMDNENGFVYYLKSTSLLGFKGSSSKSRYAITMLLNDCFSKLVLLNLTKSISFKLVFGSFVDIKYLYYIVSQFIISNFGKKYYFKRLSKRYTKNPVLTNYEAFFNNFILKKKRVKKLYGKKFIKRFFNQLFSHYTFFNLFQFYKRYIKYIFVNNFFSNFIYNLYFYLKTYLNKFIMLNSNNFLYFFKNYYFNYLYFKNDFKIIKFYLFVLQYFFNFNNQLSNFNSLSLFLKKSIMFKFNLKKKNKIHIRRLKRDNVFSRYFFKLKIIYIVKLYAFNGCRLSKLRRKRHYHHAYLRNFKNSFFNYISKKHLYLKGI